jgi:hypothetical protein
MKEIDENKPCDKCRWDSKENLGNPICFDCYYNKFLCMGGTPRERNAMLSHNWIEKIEDEIK